MQDFYGRLLWRAKILQDRLLKPQEQSIVAWQEVTEWQKGSWMDSWIFCLSLDAEMQRRLKQEEVMLKDHGVRAHAEGLKQTKDAKKKQRVVI